MQGWWIELRNYNLAHGWILYVYVYRNMSLFNYKLECMCFQKGWATDYLCCEHFDQI